MNRIKGLTAIGSGEIIGTIFSALFWFILATIVEPNEYGNIFYLISIASILTYIAPIATNYVTTTFAAKKIDVISELYTITLITSIIGGSFLYMFTERVDLIIFMFGTICYNLITGQILGEKKFKLFAVTSLIQKGLTPVLGLSFYFIFGMDGVLYALGLTYSIHVYLFLKEIHRKFNFSIIRDRYRFIFFNYGNYVTGLFGGQVDKLVIGSLFGFTLLGNYSLALQVIGVMMIIPNIIFRYILTEDLYGVHNANFKKKIIIFSLIVSVLGILLLPKIILDVFPKYTEVIDAIRIMSVVIVFSTFAKIQTSKFISQERGKIVFCGSLSYIGILFGGIFLLIEFLGIIGLSITFVVATIGQVITHILLDKRLPIANT